MTLAAPPLARAPWRLLSSARPTPRLNVTSTRSRDYVARLTRAQAAVAARIVRRIPAATTRWRYSVVLNGIAVVVPRDRLDELARVPGVTHVWPSATYRPLLDRTPALIGATQIWGPALATAGQGVKIGVVDEGIDQTHPFFAPAGYTYPAGFPKGNTRYTTPKVIVARAFPPPNTTYANASLPFDPRESEHGTHVAGIAAGNNNTQAAGVRVSGIAPRAYLGNYKALTVPTPDFGLNGNAPELAAAIEAAVRDGMDVINCSFGETEIDPRSDVVAHALNAAADAGVVPVVAAGNEFGDYGNGSIGSPGGATEAITVAASTGGHSSGPADRVASFSSGGPSPYSLLMKPDVTAPGVGVLSSVPARLGLWDSFSGTSMASPHVAGAAALLRQRHPTWTVAQIKSALELTGDPVRSGGREVSPLREGGGRIDLVRADQPRVFASPSGITFGLVPPNSRPVRTVALADAGGGAGTWTVSAGAAVVVPSAVTVPGTLRVVAATRGRSDRDVSGFIVLTHGSDRRRIPYWFRAESPRLARDPALPLVRPGTYGGTTVGAPSRVGRYRYPDFAGVQASIPLSLPGPERVYRVRLRRKAANLGVAVTAHERGVNLQPRIVVGQDENRLAGATALPFDANPYRTAFGEARPVSGVILPQAGTYSVIFDSTAGSRRGTFTFRFWIGDTTPPAIRVLREAGDRLLVRVRDAGAGVDPASLHATIDGRTRRITFARGIAAVGVAGVAPGQHTLVFRAADYQETKNNETVLTGALPNTRTIQVRVSIR